MYQEKITILNVDIDNISQDELLRNLTLNGGVVYTPNVDHLVRLQEDVEFSIAYNMATYRVCDSQIIMYASKFLGTPLREKLCGSDLFPAFYNYNKDNQNVKIFLLGGKEGVAKKAQQNINQKVGREIVIAAHSPSFGFDQNEEECREIIELIEASGANVLAIGVGTPKQEKWIYKYKSMLKNIKIILAIGATVDFEAGNIRRAPKWISNIGLEWLYRLVREPKRLGKRYLLDDLPFLGLIIKQKLQGADEDRRSRETF
ncbi:WecB/TagA/CpsF family glycosyltransferase [Merismopedia glauca]|uniref:Glycosyltransferase n=1 Tax=Merismopedia glauca CCAP 1448/3 TaxID=1296344 RepID=A0A2T1C494_9CYAN|nr:WecB/TagA/CpsF family glycosyltransferase [Merismopedia glauca]PSB03076.1 glycosyltransferase [Merismopedia glauca CCAP 1448/3]